MSHYDVDFSKTAESDYLGVVSYVARTLNNPSAAETLIEKVDDAIERLSDFPESSPLCADERLSSEGVRFARAGQYLLFYVFDEGSRKVTIVAFLHSLTDYVQRLIARFDF